MIRNITPEETLLTEQLNNTLRMLQQATDENERVRQANLWCVDCFEQLKADYNLLLAEHDALQNQKPIGYVFKKDDGYYYGARIGTQGEYGDWALPVYLKPKPFDEPTPEMIEAGKNAHCYAEQQETLEHHRGTKGLSYRANRAKFIYKSMLLEQLN
jgi:hypothetical protein